MLNQIMVMYLKLARPHHIGRIGWPGEPEPAWMRHRLEYERLASQMRAEERAWKRAARKESAPGLVARIRLARRD